VLVVDDEPMVREVVSTYLEHDGFEVEGVGDGAAALSCIKADPPDLVVLDVRLPFVGGLDVLSELRRTSEVPVILLTANGAEPDRCRGLDLGADDYVVKPFSARELAARVRSVLRRSVGNAVTDRIEIGGLAIEPSTRAVSCDGAAVDLVRREFDLLAFLASHQGQVFTRTQLLEQIWDSSPDWQDPATVTVHVRRIRGKLGGEPERFIETVWGVGYRFAS
jgi:DNA-binding response OmpR family regulator